MKQAQLYLVALCTLGLGACFSPIAPGARLSESANEMNTATRFGRMDIALEHVGPKEREGFGKAHASWHRALRIVDLELTGMNLKKSSEAEVMVNVTWQKPDQSTVLVTSLLQTWKDMSGTWFLVTEEEKGGDAGLLANTKKPAGEAANATVAPALPRYQTRVIYSSEE